MNKELLLQSPKQVDPSHLKMKATTATLPDIEDEIRCPRCSDVMVLSSAFDKFGYFYEQCNFSLEINNST